MNKYNILVLTDHSTHSQHNSIYALLNELIQHQQCNFIDVVSRGLENNNDFFLNMNSNVIYGARLDDEFQYFADGACFSKGLKQLDLDNYDIIFMRLPRPVTDEWLLWLEAIKGQAIIVNSPKGIIKTSSKEYLLTIPEVCPSIKKINSVQDAIDFSSKHPIVLKPLREYGGKGIFKIDKDKIYENDIAFDRDKYLENIKEIIINDGYIGMKYLKNVSEGDKRIIVVGGEILAASLRLPKEGSWLCNIAQGGKSVSTDITPEEEYIIETISPQLIKEGILIFGADTLVDDDGKRVLSEINTLSIGGFPQAQVQSGKPIIKQTINKIFQYADEYE